MAFAKHHTEWQGLIEVSGPFLTMPILERVFPQGLDAHDPEHFRVLRSAYEEWKDSSEGSRPNPAIHRAWIDFVFKQTLGLPDDVLAEGQAIPQALKATMSVQGEILRPDLIVKNPEGGPSAGKPRLLITICPVEQNLDKAVPGRHWNAPPATRMMELLHATDVRLGLVTNGERWMLVDAPRGETTGFASWRADLWFEEQITLRAFRSLLGVHRFFSAPDNETLEAMLSESAKNQQEVTDQLGLQVRRSVEVLIQSLDRADQDHGRELLSDVFEAVLYEAALTVMMRLVFLFSAEEKELLLLGDPLYDEHYAVSTLVAQLQDLADQHGEEVLERRFDAWVRLLSTFRAVYGGVTHERMKLLAYSGRLFDPDRFPFLEGRKKETKWRDTAATPLPVNNRTVLHLLRSLQYLELHGEARRLSFRSLDIEQIGHVYEGLLDHTAIRAVEPFLGLKGAKGLEPETLLSKLESFANKGQADLLAFLKEETGKSESSLEKALASPMEGDDVKRLRAVCGNDEELFDRILPFSGLVRDDTFDRPIVIRKGSVFVTEGTDRRSSGTHYTPRSLTEPIVRYTLEPLVYIGPSEGKPENEWTLRSAKELLDLKICDMACGSGAFLVQACRYMSELLVQAWENAEKKHHGVPGITPEGGVSSGTPDEQLIPRETEERLVLARRLVAERCLYGVDKNPLAVEMAKLSLWLITLDKNRPFTFLDHAIRPGDSLLGVTDTAQVENFHLDSKRGHDLHEGVLDIRPMCRAMIDRSKTLRCKLESFSVRDVRDSEEKARLLGESQQALREVRVLADIVVGVGLATAGKGEAAYDSEIKEWASRIHGALTQNENSEGRRAAFEQFRKDALELLDTGLPAGQAPRRPLHWSLEFPEVMGERGGVDALIGNPPFMGGRYIRGSHGLEYLNYLKNFVSPSQKGNADLIAYFLVRATALLGQKATTGFVGTKTVTQGDTLEVGLNQVVADGTFIYRAFTSKRWPGSASVLYVEVHWTRHAKWLGKKTLDDIPVDHVSPRLTSRATVRPCTICQEVRSYQGSYIHGQGFLLTPHDKNQIIHNDPRSQEVIFPCLTGSEFNSEPSMHGDRFVVYFGDMTEEQARKYAGAWRHVEQNVKAERLQYTGRGYSLARYWWRFKFPTVPLYQAIWKTEHVLVCPVVTKYLSFAWVPSRVVLLNKMFAFIGAGQSHFHCLQSSIFEVWAREWSASLDERLQFAPTDCFDNFPFPRLQALQEMTSGSYHDCRSRIMETRQEGLTKTYNLFHDPKCISGDIVELRNLHEDMDRAVAAAYGWSDLDLGHGYHETKQGLRFTISESARREVLDRLLELNHQRYAEEVKQGLHDQKGKGKPKAASSGRTAKASQPAEQKTLFDVKHEGEEPESSDSEEPLTAESEQVVQDASPEKEEPWREEPSTRPTPIEEIETNDVMAAFRQATRNRGSLERDELLKEVSIILGYQRLGPKIDEALRGHLRAAIRRHIIEADGPGLVRAGAATMADYDLEELRESFRSVMQKGRRYEREDIILTLAHYLGFARVTDSSRDPIKSAINSAIRQGILGYEGSVIWRKE